MPDFFKRIAKGESFQSFKRGLRTVQGPVTGDQQELLPRSDPQYVSRWLDDLDAGNSDDKPIEDDGVDDSILVDHKDTLVPEDKIEAFSENNMDVPAPLMLLDSIKDSKIIETSWEAEIKLVMPCEVGINREVHIEASENVGRVMGLTAQQQEKVPDGTEMEIVETSVDEEVELRLPAPGTAFQNEAEHLYTSSSGSIDTSEVTALATKMMEIQVKYDELSDAVRDYTRLSNDREEALEVLKEFITPGIRDRIIGGSWQTNVFWQFEHSNVYRASSWDRLHAYHIGLFANHLLEELLSILDELGRASASAVEQQLSQFPRWRDLNHFTELDKFREFLDGRKYEDLSKVLVLAAHSIFDPNNDSLLERQGYLLLQLMRSYLELDMYASLQSHMAKTLAVGREELKWFDAVTKYMSEDLSGRRRTPHDALRKAYNAISDKKFNFPKAHSHAHLEKMHTILKIFYLQLSNFKDVETQFSKYHSNVLAAAIICEALDAYDAEVLELLKQPEQREEEPETEIRCKHLTVGLPVRNVSIADLPSLFPPAFSPAFTNICATVSTCLSIENEHCVNVVAKYASEDPSGQRRTPHGEHKASGGDSRSIGDNKSRGRSD
ncbi:hypothetical protein BKA70DRAFT_1446098 [Coprinopsis sp. MPI-PUGE-AT-0042]|nr:hypothetical protein BKA70DRAFT_1446098 [Coprinopsis sp. MPI-PUGE-AT-0042]